MEDFSVAPGKFFLTVLRGRSLLWALVRREISSRYKGSAFGVLWMIIYPAMMLAVYTFVFGVALNSRWDVGSESKLEFAIVLYSGLLVFGFFSECVNNAPNLIVSHASYVKKVVFPLDTLPLISVCVAYFHVLVNFLVWLALYVFVVGAPHATALLFPFVLLPLVFLTLGASWFLCSLGVYLRDVSQVVGVVTTALMFLSPVFYPASILPEVYRNLMAFNPISPAIEMMRGILISGVAPELSNYFYYLVATMVLCWIGFFWFQKTRKGFADVL